MRILCPCPELFSNDAIQFLKRSCVVVAKSMDQSEFERDAPSYDGVLVRFSHQVNKEVVNSLSSVKYVITPTTGLTHIDLEAVATNGATVISLRKDLDFLNSLTNTAEHAMALLLSLVRKIPQASADVRSGRWVSSDFIGSDLKGKTIGIVGVGRVGAKLAELCRAFEMNVVAYSPRSKIHFGIKFYSNYSEFLALCDVISFNVHVKPDTLAMLSFEHLKSLKPGVIVVNTSRAEVVDPAALSEGLKSGTIGGIALDVLETPELKDCSKNQLIQLAKTRDDILITPHVGGLTEEAILRSDMYVVNKFLKQG